MSAGVAICVAMNVSTHALRMSGLRQIMGAMKYPLAMIAARMALGSNPVIATYPQIAGITTSPAQRRVHPRNAEKNMSTFATIATCNPEIANTWNTPAEMNISFSRCDMPPRSPRNIARASAVSGYSPHIPTPSLVERFLRMRLANRFILKGMASGPLQRSNLEFRPDANTVLRCMLSSCLTGCIIPEKIHVSPAFGGVSPSAIYPTTLSLTPLQLELNDTLRLPALVIFSAASSSTKSFTIGGLPTGCRQKALVMA